MPLVPGTVFAIQSGAYVNSDPRYLPKFNATTGQPTAGATSYTGSATTSANTTVTAIDLTQAEPSPEGELMRGAHDKRTVYTLSARQQRRRPDHGHHGRHLPPRRPRVPRLRHGR